MFARKIAPEERGAMGGEAGFSGGLRIVKNGKPVAGSAPARVNGMPVWLWKARNAVRPGYITGALAKHLAMPAARRLGVMVVQAELKAVLTRADGTVIDLGVVGRRVVTTAFVNHLVDQLQASAGQIASFKYHDCGTGGTAESASDTGLVTPFGGSRVSGTQLEGASANIYRTVATIPFTSSLAIVEHGVFNASSSGTLMDRTVFATVNVGNGDSIQFTYELTCSAGS